MNLPNKLTVTRMILVIPFTALLLLGKGDGWTRILSLVIFIVAALTDALDGYLARRDGLITNFGKFMDPLADKLLVCTALIALISLGELPAVVGILIIAREFVISGFRLVAAERGIVIAASFWGKIKTVCQMIMIVLILCGIKQAPLPLLTNFFIVLSCVLTLISLVDYIYKNRSVITEQKEEYDE